MRARHLVRVRARVTVTVRVRVRVRLERRAIGLQGFRARVQG